MKGQGLSITTIVVAAIALLILVVLVAVFTGQFGGFASGIQNCQSKGGDCYGSCDDAAAQAKGHTIRLPGKTNCDNEVCCISVTGTKKEEEKATVPFGSEPPSI